MWHIRIRDVSIFSIILRACFACISVRLDLKSLKLTDIHFYIVPFTKFNNFCVADCPFCILKSGLKNRNIPDYDVTHGITWYYHTVESLGKYDILQFTNLSFHVTA